MEGFFDRRISGYEEHVSPWCGHYEHVSALVPEGTRSLLDLGAGSGLELDRIFGRLPGLNVTAVDLSEKMLEKLAEKHGDKRLSIVRADYFELEFGENRFDCVIAFQTLHHFTREKKASFSGRYAARLPGTAYTSNAITSRYRRTSSG